MGVGVELFVEGGQLFVWGQGSFCVRGGVGFGGSPLWEGEGVDFCGEVDPHQKFDLPTKVDPLQKNSTLPQQKFDPLK